MKGWHATTPHCKQYFMVIAWLVSNWLSIFNIWRATLDCWNLTWLFHRCSSVCFKIIFIQREVSRTRLGTIKKSVHSGGKWNTTPKWKVPLVECQDNPNLRIVHDHWKSGLKVNSFDGSFYQQSYPNAVSISNILQQIICVHCMDDHKVS